MGLLKIILTAFILLFPVAEVGRLQFSNGVAISLNDLLLLGVILIWFGIHIFNKKRITFGKLGKPIFLFSAVGLIALLLNYFNLGINHLLISSLYLVRWFAYASIYFIINDFDKKFKQKIPYMLLFSGGLVVLFGYVQYFFYPSLKNLFYLGWDEHLYRMFSTFLDPNFAGVFFAIFFLFTLAFGLSEIKTHQIRAIILFTLSGFTLVATYLTYSRSALLMLALSIVTYLFILGKRKLIILVVLAIVLAIFIIPKSFQTEGTNFLREFSSEQRIQSFEKSISIFQTSPIYGVGFDAYRYAMNKRGLVDANWSITHSGAGTDNSFMFVLATTGIVGLIVFLWLLYKIVQIALLATRRFPSAVLTSSVTGLLVGSLFVNSLFYVLIIEWIWILASLTENS